MNAFSRISDLEESLAAAHQTIEELQHERDEARAAVARVRGQLVAMARAHLAEREEWHEHRATLEARVGAAVLRARRAQDRAQGDQNRRET